MHICMDTDIDLNVSLHDWLLKILYPITANAHKKEETHNTYLKDSSLCGINNKKQSCSQ